MNKDIFRYEIVVKWSDIDGEYIELSKNVAHHFIIELNEKYKKALESEEDKRND